MLSIVGFPAFLETRRHFVGRSAFCLHRYLQKQGHRPVPEEISQIFVFVGLFYQPATRPIGRNCRASSRFRQILPAAHGGR
jgi:hypothetical protein